MPNMRISILGPLMGALVILGFLIVVVTTMVTTQQTRVGGPIYRQIKNNLDVAGDVEPPPEFIVEAYLEATLALQETNAAGLEQQRRTLARLHEEFNERHNYWAAQKLPPGIREKLLVTSYQPAVRFWSITEERFLPALARNDRPAAEAAYADMTAAYEVHHAVVNSLIDMIELDIRKREAEALTDETRLTVMAWAVSGLVFVFVLSAVFGLLGRIVHPLTKMTAMVARMAQGESVEEAEADDRADEISDLFRALNNYNRMQGELLRAEKMAALGGMVAAMSHEINTPIGNSLAVASALSATLAEFDKTVASSELRRSTLSEFSQRFSTGLNIAFSNLTRAADLIGNFKRVAVDQTSERRRRFDLEVTVTEIVTLLRPTYKHSTHLLRVEIPAGIELDSFPGALGQVLTNLVNNALLHGFEGRENGEIQIIGAASGLDEITLEVRDNGCGIPAQALARVFDPFYTTKLGKGGSGLGLHIVYAIVHGILGGTIQVESKVNEGTVFLLRIPRSAPVRSAEGGAAVDAQNSGPGGNQLATAV